MSETKSQEGLETEAVGSSAEAPALAAPDTGDTVLLAQSMLDEETTDIAPAAVQDLLPIPDPAALALFDEPALEVEAGPPSTGAGNGGGGGSTYQSDLGSLIGGLQANSANSDTTGTVTPATGIGAPTPPDTIFILPAASLAPVGAAATSGTAPAASSPAPFVPPEDPVGPGADQPLFSNKADDVDLNAIDVGGYLDGTQYDAGNGNDTVILPGTPREALEAGFTPGTLFLAGKGNDEVTGGDLADIVDGGKGNDLLIGGGGDDSLEGGKGKDTLSGGDGNDHLAGDGGNDSLQGGASDDSLFGGDGRDSLDGGLGDDLLDGGNGRDLLLGGAGDDTLTGGRKNDTLHGGEGDDVLSGGNDKDVFSFSLAGNEGNDLILDFQTGNGGDRLQIADLIDANSDSIIDTDDLDAGAHSVTGTADSVVITFDTGSILTLDGLNGTGVNSFADLLDMKVNIDVA
ncbi:MAG: hypothetical protein Tsb0032_15540 [Kiloniellaceae bacterium]